MHKAFPRKRKYVPRGARIEPGLPWRALKLSSDPGETPGSVR